MKRMLKRLFRAGTGNKVVAVEGGSSSKSLKTLHGETKLDDENQNEKARRNQNENSTRHPHYAGPTLTGSEFMSIAIHNWSIKTNYQQQGIFSPCVPRRRRLFPLNMSLAVKTVSDDHIAILYQTLLGGMISNLQSIVPDPAFNSRKFYSHFQLENLECYQAWRKSLREEQSSSHHQEFSDFTDLPNPPGYIDDHNVDSGSDIPSLPFSKIVEGLSGVPIHSRDPDEKSMIRRRDVTLARLKDNLRHATSSQGLNDNFFQGDERLVCKMLIVMEIFLFGHPQAPVIGVDEVVEAKEVRIIRWQHQLEQYQKSKLNSKGAAIDSMLEAGSLGIGAEAFNGRSTFRHQFLKKRKSSTLAEFLPKIKKMMSGGLLSTTVFSAVSQGLGSQGFACGNPFSTCYSSTSSQLAINNKDVNLAPNSSPKAANSELNPASCSSGTSRDLMNGRHGPACDRDSLLHQLGILHFKGGHFPEYQQTPDHAYDPWYSHHMWYLYAEFSYSTFHRCFRVFEQELYILIDRYNGDEKKLDYIMNGYGI